MQIKLVAAVGRYARFELGGERGQSQPGERLRQIGPERQLPPDLLGEFFQGDKAGLEPSGESLQSAGQRIAGRSAA